MSDYVRINTMLDYIRILKATGLNIIISKSVVIFEYFRNSVDSPIVFRQAINKLKKVGLGTLKKKKVFFFCS